MKKTISLLFTGLLICAKLFSQAPSIQWQNTIGGDTTDVLVMVEQTFDGGYILGGYSLSASSGDKSEGSQGKYDYWILMLDANGNIVWQNTIGGDNDDYLEVIHQMNDSGYIVGGYSYSNISGDKTENSCGQGDYWVMKLDASGNILWQNTIGGSYEDQLYCLDETADGGYIAGGRSSSGLSCDKTENSLGWDDFWIVKLDASGLIQWDNTIGGNEYDYLQSIAQTDDGGYILGGLSLSDISGDKSENHIGDFDYWVVKLDAFGIIQWQNTIGGSAHDNLYKVEPTADHGYILSGFSLSYISGDKTENNLGAGDFWIIKLDSVGTILWENTIGGSGDDKAYAVQVLDDGYIVAGRSSSNICPDKSENCVGDGDYWIVKLDDAGNILWDKTTGGTSADYLYSVAPTNDAGFILGGLSYSNTSGDKTEDSQGWIDYWVVKLGFDTATVLSELPFTNEVKCFPDPATDYFTIHLENNSPHTISIVNGLGEILFQTQSTAPTLRVDVRSFASGVYFVIVKDKDGNCSWKKIMKI